MTKPNKPQYGSDLIVDLLRALEIEYVSLNPGASFRGLHDSLVNYGGNHAPEVVLCCHEEVAVSMAFGYARVKGKPMAAAVHNVVGLQHATMGIFNAWSSRVPVLVLGGTGPMDTAVRRSGADWVHTALVQSEQVREYCKWDDQPASVRAMPESLVRAYRLATTEPTGPVYVCFDAALQEKRLNEEIPVPNMSRYPASLPLQSTEEAFDKTIDWLLSAKRPVIIADWVGRTQEGYSALLELADLLVIPVLDRGGRLNFPFLHPLNLTGQERAVLSQADVVLALDVADLHGALSERKSDSAERVPISLLPASARIAQVQVKNLAVKSWAQDYDKLPQLDLNIHAETKVFLPELLRRIKGEKKKLAQRRDATERRKTELQKVRSEFRARLEGEARRRWDEKPITAFRLAAEMAQTLKNEDWVLTHSSTGLKEKYFLDCRKFNQFLGRRWHGGVGVGLPISLGAALALKGSGKICVGVQPDGDFLFNPSTLWTAVHHEIPLLMIVFNNRSYYNDEEHQRVVALDRGRPVENRHIGIRLDKPAVNFVKLAEAYEVQGFGPVTDPAELGKTLQMALRALKETGRPILVDVVTENR